VSTLFVVATPIGNLEDLTRRAERVLVECDRVLAEDTRRTGILLRHVGSERPVVSLHAHNEASRVPQALQWLAAGEVLVLVSDAGTPVVSDPGVRLVRAAEEAGHAVVPVPGASAVVSALAVSGLPADRFTFLGFLPRKGRERAALLDRIVLAEESVVLFESPERLVRLLDELCERCDVGAPGERRVAVCRELTKLHEDVFRGTLSEAARYYREQGVRGEITLVVEGGGEGEGSDEVDEVAGTALARALLGDGVRPSRAAREVSSRLGISRNAAYEIVQKAREME
jgi:16S rRNA (cytidine1402-2'-O)-methyltransferase